MYTHVFDIDVRGVTRNPHEVQLGPQGGTPDFFEVKTDRPNAISIERNWYNSHHAKPVALGTVCARLVVCVYSHTDDYATVLAFLNQHLHFTVQPGTTVTYPMGTETEAGRWDLEALIAKREAEPCPVYG